MIKIDHSLLQDIGLGSLPNHEKDSLLKHIYETLEMRVGMRLADQMSNQQLDEFEQYFEARDDAGAFKWLETNFPNYKDVVQEEFDKLKTEVQAAAPQIMAAAQNPAPLPQAGDSGAAVPLAHAQAQAYPPPQPQSPMPPQPPMPPLDVPPAPGPGPGPQQPPYQPPQQPHNYPPQQPPAGPGATPGAY